MSSPKGAKLDWEATWRGWVKRHSASPHARAGPNDHAPIKLTAARQLMEMSRGKPNASPGSLFADEPNADSAGPVIDGELVADL